MTMHDRYDRIDRRTFVHLTGAATGTLAIAGCLGGDDDDGDEPNENGDGDDDTDTDGNGNENGDGDENGAAEDVDAAPEFIEVENPPDAVYVPTHREAMRMLDPIEAGDYVLAPMLSYPHPFWVVAGDEVSREVPAEGFGVHMMFTLWDAETGIVLPVDEGAQITVEKDGESVDRRSPWTMISQEMGFHFGDNVPLPEDGTYAVEVTIPAVSTRKTGDLEGRLEETETSSFEFEYDDEFRQEVVGGVEYFDEDVWGNRGAIEPMDHGGGGHDHERGNGDGGDAHEEHGDDGHGDHDGHEEHGDGHDHDHAHDHHVAYSALPQIEDYSGTLLVDPDADEGPETNRDLPRSGDAAFLATVFDSDFRLADGDEQYLLVSPRTPYNRVPLADMSLRATIERDGETVTETSLAQTLDGEYDLHYGASVADIQPGDSVTIEIETPPQVARHQGYETAFLDMSPVELTVPEGSDD